MIYVFDSTPTKKDALSCISGNFATLSTKAKSTEKPYCNTGEHTFSNDFIVKKELRGLTSMNVTMTKMFFAGVIVSIPYHLI